jgi:hypothetical protein
MLKAKTAWSKVFWALNENNINPRIVYPVKLSFKIDVEVKVYQYKQKLKQYMITKSPCKRFFKEFCTQTMKTNKTMNGQAVPNQRRKKDKEIDSGAHNQTIKQQKNQMTEIIYLSIITLNVNRLNSPKKDTIWQTGLKRKIQQSVAYRRPISLTETTTRLGERLEEDLPSQWLPQNRQE